MSSEPHEDYVDEWYENEEDVPVPDWHMAIIQERLARYESEGTTWTPWEEFEKELFDSSENSLKN